MNVISRKFFLNDIYFVTSRLVDFGEEVLNVRKFTKKRDLEKITSKNIRNRVVKNVTKTAFSDFKIFGIDV